MLNSLIHKIIKYVQNFKSYTHETFKRYNMYILRIKIDDKDNNKRKRQREKEVGRENIFHPNFYIKTSFIF